MLSAKEPIVFREMLDCLPPGEARLQRPASVVRYTYEDFEAAANGRMDRSWRANSIPIVPTEAVSPGDEQVMAPDQEAEKRDRQTRDGDERVAERRLPRETGDELAHHAHARQDHDVDGRV